MALKHHILTRQRKLQRRGINEQDRMVMHMHKNYEGYPDPTAGDAIREADRPPEHVETVIRRMKVIAGWHGLEVIGRIWLRDPETGREYR